jgi:hypothetical protein
MVLNDFFSQLGCDDTDLSVDRFIVPHKFFDNSTLNYRDSSIEPIICNDLVNLIMRSPPKQADHVISMLAAAYDIMTTILAKCETSSTLEEDELKEIAKISNNISILLDLTPKGSSPPLPSPSGDRLVLSDRLLDMISSLREELQPAYTTPRVGKIRTIRMDKILSMFNDILELLDIEKMTIGRLNPSYLIGISASQVDDSVNIEIDTTQDNAMYIPLSGEGLERLSKQQLKDIITLVSSCDPEDDRFEVVRCLATTLYYKLS